MAKKYKLTDETIQRYGKTLHRIEALKDFGDVKKGDKGGFVESEANLSHYGTAWVADDGVVMDSGHVAGRGQVTDNGHVVGRGQVTGNGRVTGDGWVTGNGRVMGDGWVTGNGRVTGSMVIIGDAVVSSTRDVFTVSNIGSEDGTLTVARSKSGGLVVTRGCFCGDLAEFEAAVAETHGDNQYGKEYRAIIEYIKLRFGADAYKEDV